MRDESQGRDEKAGCDDPLLLWAVRDSNKRTFVHVGLLTPAEKGSACHCLCRECDEKLVAINVDKPASHFEKPRTQRRHFKHSHSYSGESQCLSSVAKFLALQLFIEQDAIYLPPRTRTVSRDLPTGVTVYAPQEIPGESVQVTSRTWVDDVSAILHLKDGRELLFTVRAHQNVDNDARSMCVLSLVGVNDPAIASWDTDKILKHLSLQGCGMEWESHWDDAELDAQKDGDLAEEEDQFLGGIPAKWLENLEGKQLSETILHWLIKKTIAGAGTLTVPAFPIPVRQKMPDGTTAEEIAISSGGVLQLEDIRLERRFDTIVPDVICRARKIGSNGLPIELLIEAAVTHYIDDDKRKKIVASGVPCIQIRADLFAKAGSVRVAEIEKIICSDASVKEWIVHPWIADEVSKAKRRLAERFSRMQKNFEAQAAEDRRREQVVLTRLADRAHLESWIKTTGDSSLCKGYLKALKATWTGQAPPMLGTEPISLTDLWDELKHRKIVGANRQSIESNGGLLRALVRINGDAFDEHGGALIDLLATAMSYARMATGNALVIMFALKQKTPSMLPLQAETFRESCERLHNAIRSGDARYCRNTEHDRLYALLFPGMASDLYSEYGTATHVSRMLTEQQEKKAADERRRGRRQTRLALAYQLREKKIKSQQAEGLKKELSSAMGLLRWRRSFVDGPGAAVLYGLYSGHVHFQSIAALDVLKTAIAYRDTGAGVDSALKAMPFNHAADIPEAVRLLQMSGLCFSTK